MDLHSLIRQLGGPTRVAAICGIKTPSVCGWKAIPIERCVSIEQATGGRVRRWDLRPEDWRDLWPELCALPDAPPGGSRRAKVAA